MRVQTLKLSKSRYMDGLQCEKKLWLMTHRKDLQPENDPSLQAIFDQGHAIGELAQQYFPGGILIKADHLHLQQALAETQAALRAGAHTLYEATFDNQGVLVRADILRKSKEKPGSWEIIEVKGSTDADQVHIDDLAIQSWVLEEAGLRLSGRLLMVIDTEYVRKGPINVKELLRLIDLNEEVKPVLKTIPGRLKEFFDVLARKQEPEVEIGHHCSNPYDCAFEEYCWRDIPEYSIYNITRLSWDKKDALRGLEILKVAEVPEDFDLSKHQVRQVEVERSQVPHIDRVAIRRHLAGLKEPVSFLDFETINPAIPPYDGLHPYGQMPFQFSLRLYKDSQEKEHVEFLGDGQVDPRPQIARLLAEKVPDRGSVVAYHASFEGQVLSRLADSFPKQAAALRSIRDRLWDLETPFAKRDYVHPRFHGRSSIKEVLPALVPNMTYEGMEIGEGGAASRVFVDFMDGKLPPADVRRLRKELLRYCGQDTLAMVKVLEILKLHAGSGA